LLTSSLVLRYNNEDTRDGFVEREGTFNICTFWYAPFRRSIVPVRLLLVDKKCAGRTG
jgi:hypothetical protein